MNSDLSPYHPIKTKIFNNNQSDMKSMSCVSKIDEETDTHVITTNGKTIEELRFELEAEKGLCNNSM